MALDEDDFRTINMIVDGCLKKWVDRIVGLAFGTAMIAFVIRELLDFSLGVSIIAAVLVVWIVDHFRERLREGTVTWRGIGQMVLGIITLIVVIGGLIFLWATGAFSDL